MGRCGKFPTITIIEFEFGAKSGIGHASTLFVGNMPVRLRIAEREWKLNMIRQIDPKIVNASNAAAKQSSDA